MPRAWGITIRDGFGQTETTAQVGNSPGPAGQAGSMGRPLPGYAVALLDPISGEPARGRDRARPRAAPARADDRLRDDRRAHRGGDARRLLPHRRRRHAATRTATSPTSAAPTTCSRPPTTASSPFELESVLMEHEAVAEAAVVPVARPAAARGAQGLRGARRRATSRAARRALASSRSSREQLAPYKRIRRLEFGELPKTISGKIRRVELRDQEDERTARVRTRRCARRRVLRSRLPELKR